MPTFYLMINASLMQALHISLIQALHIIASCDLWVLRSQLICAESLRTRQNIFDRTSNDECEAVLQDLR